ncbi:MAG: pseudouridine synthase, partial [Anaerolineales bacterium]|nr:pseudouridine synthase [Anaerolineales bacterium]
MAEQRVQKLLAAAGYGSRRTCEKFISAGRVRVNGNIVKLGDKADPGRDTVTIDGQPVEIEQLKYAILNKPRGVVSSLNAQGERATVREMIPLSGRLYPVGRLDMDSEGLVLMTNDGDLANLLTHPRYGHEKEYEVLVDGHPKDEQLQSWRRGVVLEGEWTSPARVVIFRKGASGTWLRVTMREGRKHQIRRTAEAIGLWVKRLVRVRIGSLRLGDLESGQWRELRPDEVRKL